MKTLNDVFLAQLRDIYYSEQQILKAFPGMIGAASGRELRDAFASPSAETDFNEIAMQECLAAWARHMAYEGIVQLLNQTLENEKIADNKLIQIADCLTKLEAAQSAA